jgi:hypothetical protein
VRLLLPNHSLHERKDIKADADCSLWVSPIQIAIGIGLLIGNLGPSALVGLALLLLGFPIQMVLVRTMFKQRKKGVKWTDKRVSMMTEVRLSFPPGLLPLVREGVLLWSS